jgi:hypothetical protein
MNCLPFWSTGVHPWFLVGFVLLDLQFYVYALQIIVCPFGFVLFLLAIVLSVFNIWILITPLVSSNSSYDLAWALLAFLLPLDF